MIEDRRMRVKTTRELENTHCQFFRESLPLHIYERVFPLYYPTPQCNDKTQPLIYLPVPWVGWEVLCGWAWLISSGSLMFLHSAGRSAVAGWSRMASHVCLIFRWLLARVWLPFLSPSSRLDWARSHGSSRVPSTARGQPQCSSTFKAPAWITFANIPLAKVSHMAKSGLRSGQIDFTSW